MQIWNYEIVRGLKIRTPFIGRILAGEKTMELRGQNTRIRGRIALIRSRTNLIVGTCNLATVRGPYTRDEIDHFGEEHCLSGEELSSLSYHRFYGWMLSDIEQLPEPIIYKRKSGPIIWVKL